MISLNNRSTVLTSVLKKVGNIQLLSYDVSSLSTES